MNQEQAFSTIEQALNLATNKGAFNLAEVQTILAALSVLKNGEQAIGQAAQEQS